MSKDIHVLRKSPLQTSRSRGFGFVTMKTVEDAAAVIKELNGIVSTLVERRWMFISWSRLSRNFMVDVCESIIQSPIDLMIQLQESTEENLDEKILRCEEDHLDRMDQCLEEEEDGVAHHRPGSMAHKVDLLMEVALAVHQEEDSEEVMAGRRLLEWACGEVAEDLQWGEALADRLEEDTTMIVGVLMEMRTGDDLVEIAPLAQLLADVVAVAVEALRLEGLETTIVEEIVIVVIVTIAATEIEESVASVSAAIEGIVIVAALLDATAGINQGNAQRSYHVPLKKKRESQDRWKEEKNDEEVLKCKNETRKTPCYFSILPVLTPLICSKTEEEGKRQRGPVQAKWSLFVQAMCPVCK
jgi:hypothetical protein